MRIGIDVSVLRHGLSNGTAVYAFNLVKALLRLPAPPQLTAFFCARPSEDSRAALEELARGGARVWAGPAPWRWSPDGAWWLPVAPPMAHLLDAVDLFHVGEFHLPPIHKTPWVATVHDLTAITLPQHHLFLNRALHRRRLGWITRGSGEIISISQSTKADLMGLFGVEEERIHVVPLALGHDTRGGKEVAQDQEAVLSGLGLGDTPYILTVGTLEPRKNQGALVRAFESLPPRFQGVKLVMVGDRGWRGEEIRKTIQASPARDRIRVLGRVPADSLPALYAGARIFAFPSLYEGFGLPILEAMAAGAPVLTSNCSSMPEVSGNAALLVDPHAVDSIREGLERLLADEGLRADLSRKGREREEAFTWEKTAQGTMDVYRRALDGRGRTP